MEFHVSFTDLLFSNIYKNHTDSLTFDPLCNSHGTRSAMILWKWGLEPFFKLFYRTLIRNIMSYQMLEDLILEVIVANHQFVCLRYGGPKSDSRTRCFLHTVLADHWFLNFRYKSVRYISEWVWEGELDQNLT